MLKRVFFTLALSACLSSLALGDDFHFTDIQGHPQNLNDYKGKWVLVNFWATWCPPCRIEIPDLINLEKKYSSSRLAVIGIAMDYNDASEVNTFVKEQHINYPIVLGDSNIAAQIGTVDGLPTSYLYNPQGKAVAHQLGALTSDEIMSYINAKK